MQTQPIDQILVLIIVYRLPCLILSAQRKIIHLGIHTGVALRHRSELKLIRQSGKMGRFYYLKVRGEGARSVVSNRCESISVEAA
jgi:hypothetical protein